MENVVDNFRKEFFLEAPSHVALNNAGTSLLTKKSFNQLKKVSEALAFEGAFIHPLFAEREKAKETLAQFLNAKVSEVAWVQNCSAALSMVAQGYEQKSHEEIVILENEYPANFYPWVERSKRNQSQLRIVPVEKDLTRVEEKIISQINSRTRIVALSHIQSDCGFKADITSIAAAAHKVGAIVVLDVIQSMGIETIDFQKLGADIICGGSHKWLCGPIGAGFMVAKENFLEKITPCLHGANNYGTFEDASCVTRTPFQDARRFEQGTVSFHSILGTAASLEVLKDYNVDNLGKKALFLRSYLTEHLNELGFHVYGCSKATGPQVSVSHPKVKIEEFSIALNKEKISHALRPAPVHEQKVLRLSPHAYNTKDEIAFAIETLKKVLA